MTEKYYIESADSLLERVNRIDNIIEELEMQAVTSADTSTTESYSFDDGQVSISMSYRSPAGIANAIMRYESLKQKYLNKLNGRDMAMRPWQGLKNRIW